MRQAKERFAVVILAAGEGKRMKSAMPKVLIPIGGQPMIFHILTRLAEVDSSAPVCIVVGHDREKVEQVIQNSPHYQNLQISFVEQLERRGTGDAARVAMSSEWGSSVLKKRLPVLVLPGDLPLIPSRLIREMAESLPRTSALRLLSVEMTDPTGYGRIVRRGKKGSVLRIVEERDANLREKMIKEVAASIYLFNPSFLKAGLRRLTDKNSQKEYYLTDLVSQAARMKKKMQLLRWEDPADLRGVNNPWELSLAGRIFNERHIQYWALRGVRFVDPFSTWIDQGVELAEDVTIHPGVLLCGKTRIGRRTVIGARSVLKNVEVEQGVEIKVGTVAENSKIRSGAKVGPYAHLRPGSDVGKDSKIGNFVELKKAKIGRESSVAHLSYLGDCQVGDRVNIGCGFVTCNFDGRVVDGKRKHTTIIEDDAFVGSDCQAIAPVTIGSRAYVASGSTINKDVPSGALAIARSRQVNKEGYAKRIRNFSEVSEGLPKPSEASSTK